MSRDTLRAMNVEAVECCRCGAPLSDPGALPALVDCLYCGTLNSITSAASRPTPIEEAIERRKASVSRFTEALVATLNAGQQPFEALRAASAAHLGIAGRPDTVARIALAIARDFERETGASVVRDALVFSRIAQAYLLALDELRTSESYDMNLPFLTATANGPVHLRRTLTARTLVELAARDPHAKAQPPAPSPAAPPAKKKGWWPFS